MAVQIHRLTGAGPSGANITSNTRLNAEDAHSVSGTTNPIVVPVAGTNYSYWASTRLYFDGSGTGTINNIKWYTDGSNGLGTGVGLVAATAAVYAQATGTPGTTGTQLTVANYGNGTTDLDAEPVDAFSLNSGAPLSVAGTVTNPLDEYFGSRVVLQVTVGTTAGPGATAQETMTWRYDSTIP
jgi:hypothetical protein